MAGQEQRQRVTLNGHGAAFCASDAQAEGPFREDGYFNMTKAAQHFNKRLPNFWRLDEVREYMCIMVKDIHSTVSDVSELNADVRTALHWYELGSIRMITLKEEAALRTLLVDTTQGHGGGTWAHPKLAVFFARWLSAEFSWWCDMQIDDILRGRSVAVPVQQAPAPEPQQPTCPAVHQKPTTATTTP